MVVETISATIDYIKLSMRNYQWGKKSFSFRRL